MGPTPQRPTSWGPHLEDHPLRAHLIRHQGVSGSGWAYGRLWGGGETVGKNRRAQVYEALEMGAGLRVGTGRL